MWRFVLLLAIMPTAVMAHTKWFAEEELQPFTTSEPTALYLGVWALAAALLVSAGIYLERRGTLQLTFLHPTTGHAFVRAASAFSMVAGAFFIIAGLYGYLFSPNLTAAAGIPEWIVYAQIVIGAAFLFGVAARVAAVGLFALWIAGFFYVGWISMLEDIWVASTAAFILIVGNDYFSLVSVRIIGKYVQHLKSYALPILRIGAGATLLVLGFSEKILRPEFGVHFLELHSWNFMALLGFPYSDYLFTLSAGAVESLFGLIFILGVVTRFNALVVATFFSIPLFILGPIELAGHMPHFAAIAILVFFGAGNHFKIPRR
jgi:uncharacterized membrane protein YphA (DoxX/SURF4 family)